MLVDMKLTATRDKTASDAAGHCWTAVVWRTWCTNCSWQLWSASACGGPDPWSPCYQGLLASGPDPSSLCYQGWSASGPDPWSLCYQGWSTSGYGGGGGATVFPVMGYPGTCAISVRYNQLNPSCQPGSSGGEWVGAFLFVSQPPHLMFLVRVQFRWVFFGAREVSLLYWQEAKNEPVTEEPSYVWWSCVTMDVILLGNAMSFFLVSVSNVVWMFVEVKSVYLQFFPVPKGANTRDKVTWVTF